MRLRAALVAMLLAAPALAGGTLHHHPAFGSGAKVPPRDVWVWVPDDCTPKTRCPVIYMPDGQNLFEPGNAFGGAEWGMDEAMSERPAGRRAIVVGLANSGSGRWAEYVPPALLAALGPVPPGADGADRYLAFVADEVKPFVDQRYPTRLERQSTFHMGSSMGGLLSLHALVSRPALFGAAAGLSTHWPISAEKAATPEAVASALKAWLASAPPGRGRFYTDRGDQTLDALYLPFARAIIPLFGPQGPDFRALAFPGTSHSEAAWRARLAIPLAFLLDGDVPATALAKTEQPAAPTR